MPPTGPQHVMTKHVRHAAVWDPYLPSWLRGSWGAPGLSRNTNSSRVGSGRIEDSDKQPESRVLRKQTDPAGGGCGDVRTDQQAAGGARSHRGCSCTQKVAWSTLADADNHSTTTWTRDGTPILPHNSSLSISVYLYRDNTSL